MEFRIIEHGLVDSTSERAFAALSGGQARDGDVHVALGQTAGRGRRGASWVSEPGTGLYASFVLRPARVLDPVALTMGAGLAVHGTLMDLGLVRAQLKWPNDLLIGGAKVCGILAETRGLDPARPHCVLGVGINVGQRQFPPELSGQRAVTSLALCGVNVAVGAVLERLLPHLGRELERAERDPEDTLHAYFAATGLLKQRVRVLAGEQELVARCTAVELARGLCVALDDGTQRWLRLEHVRGLYLIPQ